MVFSSWMSPSACSGGTTWKQPLPAVMHSPQALLAAVQGRNFAIGVEFSRPLDQALQVTSRTSDAMRLMPDPQTVMAQRTPPEKERLMNLDERGFHPQGKTLQIMVFKGTKHPHVITTSGGNAEGELTTDMPGWVGISQTQLGYAVHTAHDQVAEHLCAQHGRNITGHLLLLDGWEGHFSNTSMHIFKENHVSVCFLRSQNSENDQSNDNRPNASLRALFSTSETAVQIERRYHYQQVG